ncbi:MAG: PD40 domain-containing protein [Polyangiaceae bacterium]|nr:PD40 domain-containing protein [Polyangiaceae bacterium]
MRQKPLLLLPLFPACLLALSTGCGDGAKGANGAGAASGTLYLNGNVHNSIYSFDLASGAVKKLVAGADPFITPEGTILCKNSTTGDLGEYSVDGTTFGTILTQNDQEPFTDTFDDNIQNPRLSPDGQYVVYEGQFGYKFDLYVVKRATGALVASFTTDVTGGGWERPTFTPDGRLVVAGANANPGLYVSDAAFTTFTRFDAGLAAPHQPAVSPDGQRVAFVLNDHIYVVNLDGTGLSQITTSDGKESWPSWSPDGKSLAIYGKNSILLVPLGDGEVVDLKDLNDKFVVFDSTTSGQMHWR